MSAGPLAAPEPLVLALCQTAGCFGDPAGALGELDAQARQARRAGADLLVLPELFLSGYNLGPERARALAEPLDGRSIVAARRIAADAGIALCFGFAEAVDGAVANSAVLVGADGAVALVQRKVHLFGALDRAMFSVRGDGFGCVDHRGVRIGMAICYDIEFPESARLLALQGADLLLVPTALMEPYDVVPWHVVPARAYENQAYVAYANHCGAEDGLGYIGRSCIAGPDGDVIAAAGTGPELLLATIDPQRLQQARARDTFFADRRPAVYAALARSGSGTGRSDDAGA